MFDPLEGRNELETHETFLVPLDVLKQELVLGDVGITEVKLHLLDNGLAQVIGGVLHGRELLLDILKLGLFGNAKVAGIASITCLPAAQNGIIRNSGIR